jgi:predicted aconitase
LLHPELIHADKTLATNGKRLMDAHLALGCEATWTCAPYQTDIDQPLAAKLLGLNQMQLFLQTQY